MNITDTHAKQRRRRLIPHGDGLEERNLLSGFSPAELTAAYGLNSIYFSGPTGAAVKGNGAGQTIALIEAYHDPTIVSDLATFDRTYKLPSANIAVDNLAGSTLDQGWALEESLDVEWAHAIAPAANILVVEAASPTLQGLISAVNAARRAPGVVTISMSWGFSEFRNESSYNNVFTTPAGHTGITFVAASGDSGSQGGPEWPSVAPDVLSVGGTSLELGAAGAYQSEIAWLGSSGGYSRYEAEPEFQRIVQRTGKRSSPDVSFNGDPNTGVNVYQTSPLTGLGSWYVVGGTSEGAPAWAAIIAIADQGRTLKGQASLDGATQTLPTIYAVSPSDFNVVTPIRHGKRSATATANTSTGLGSPVGKILIADLVDSQLDESLTTSLARVLPHAKPAHRTVAVARKPVSQPTSQTRNAPARNAIHSDPSPVMSHLRPQAIRES
jgi:subtilase family serine protease